MKRPTLSFIIRTDRLKKGNYPIVIKLYFNGKNKYINTPFTISQNEWLSKKERAKYDIIINAYLDGISEKFNRLLMDPLNFNNVDDFACYLFDLKSKDHMLVDYISKFIQTKIAKNDVKPKTIGRFERMSNVMKQYLVFQNIENIQLNNVDYKFINQFDTYLKSKILNQRKQKLNVNTINKYHSLFRSILIQASNENIIQLNPYKMYKLKSKPTFRNFLNNEEISILLNTNFENSLKEKIRLIYLFSCFTGIRFSDAQRLSKNNLITSNDGKKYLSFLSSKSSVQQEIPLLNEAVNILNSIKTKFEDELNVSQKLLPKISNQKFNDNLRIIASELKIDKPLSHHSSRHRFATYMLSSGVAPQVLQILLGHSNIRETMLYAKITPNYLAQETEKGNQSLNNISI